MKIKLLILLTALAAILHAQKANLPKNYAPLSIMVQYGIQKPFGTLAQRFGFNSTIGIGFESITLPRGWIVSCEANFLYGNKVKEDVLKNIRTPEGNILGDIGTYATVTLKERGFYTGANLGKLFTLKDNGNRLSGIRLTLGGGFLKHKIRLTNADNAATQVVSPYREGYDRMTYGMALTQFLGYQIVSRDKTINLTLGMDFTEGFTRNRRGFNFDTQQRDDAKRLDVLAGFHAALSVPLFTNQKADDIEY